jgi:hypothetical protein
LFTLVEEKRHKSLLQFQCITMAALAAQAEEPVMLIAKFRGEEIELPVTTATQIIQIKVCKDTRMNSDLQ